jgi:hypothetical protein
MRDRLPRNPLLRRDSRNFRQRVANLVRQKSKISKAVTNHDPLAETEDSFFKREAYMLLRGVIRDGRESLFSDILRQHKARYRGQHDVSDRPFKLGLLAMDLNQDQFSREYRSVLGDQMEYAHRHGVPSKYFIGFSKAVGPIQLLRQKIKCNHWEPGFEKAKREWEKFNRPSSTST